MSETDVSITGMPETGASEEGHHFRSSKSGHRPSPLRFAGHVVEMMVSMMVGMMAGHVIAVAVSGGLSIGEIVARYPVLSVVTMAISMTVPMVAWMRFRGHSLRCRVEMAGSMVLPAVLLITLYWLGVGGAPGAYMSVSTVAMIALMVYRRSDYGL